MSPSSRGESLHTFDRFFHTTFLHYEFYSGLGDDVLLIIFTPQYAAVLKHKRHYGLVSLQSPVKVSAHPDAGSIATTKALEAL